VAVIVAVNTGEEILLDDADVPLVAGYRWAVHGRGRNRYAQSSRSGGGTVYMHRLILDCEEADHVNGHGLDNRRANLRAATHSQNMANARIQEGRSSRYKGVTWDRYRSCWVASITVDYRRRDLGHYDVEDDASRAYDAAAREAWGEFARLNFPGSTEPPGPRRTRPAHRCRVQRVEADPIVWFVACSCGWADQGPHRSRRKARAAHRYHQEEAR
jgi:hypothetical protein